MFIVAQLPIGDFRAFTEDANAQRLLSPSWPPRTSAPAQFVRHFGRAVPRRRGVDYAWSDERAFCRADRALRLPQLPPAVDPSQLFDVWWRGQIRCAFRRLLSSGRVARFEVGFAFQREFEQSHVWRWWDQAIKHGHDPLEYSGLEAHADDVHPLEIASFVLGLRTTVSELSGQPSERPLALQSDSLAALYFRATTRLRNADLPSIRPDWRNVVAGGAPVVLIECKSLWIEALPKDFVRIAPESTNAVQLAFGRLSTPWGAIDIWVLGISQARAKAIRDLRLCLLRLHAEQQVLSLALDRLQTGAIEYQAGAASGDRVDAFLNEATRLIDRQSWAGIEQSQILAAFDAIASTQAAVRTDLGRKLDGMRLQIRRKVERFERRASVRAITIESGGQYIESPEGPVSQKVINIGAGAQIHAPIVVADQIERSFNTLSNAAIDTQVKTLLEQVLKQVAAAAAAAPAGTAADLADNAESLAKEIARPKPRRKWYELSVEGLKEAAEAVGEVGKPILETTAKLVPLLAALWP